MKQIILPIVVALIASGCCQTPPPVVTLPPGQLGESPTLTGKAENWVGRALTLKLEVQQGRGAGAGLNYLGNGTVDAAGNFSILLPGLTQMQPYLQTAKDFYDAATCPTVKIAPTDVKVSNAVNLAVFDGPSLIGRITLEPSRFSIVGDEFAALLFYDRTAMFNVTCTPSGLTNHLDARVGLGWNVDVNELYAPGLSHEFVDALPAGIKWTYSSLSVTTTRDQP
jgi:hypothetical protein